VPGDRGFKIGLLRGIGLHKKTIAVLGGKAKGRQGRSLYMRRPCCTVRPIAFCVIF
jgi:hypothetical protein